MTRAEIIAGLDLLIEQLANDVSVPKAAVENGWEPHTWAYLKGIASCELLRLRNSLATLP